MVETIVSIPIAIAAVRFIMDAIKKATNLAAFGTQISVATLSIVAASVVVILAGTWPITSFDFVGMFKNAGIIFSGAIAFYEVTKKR